MPKPSFSRSNNNTTASRPTDEEKKRKVSTSNKIFGVVSVVIVTYYFFFGGFGSNNTKEPVQSKDQATPAVVSPSTNSDTNKDVKSTPVDNSGLVQAIISTANI